MGVCLIALLIAAVVFERQRKRKRLQRETADAWSAFRKVARALSVEAPHGANEAMELPSLVWPIAGATLTLTVEARARGRHVTSVTARPIAPLGVALRVASIPSHGFDVASFADTNVNSGDDRFDAAFYASGASNEAFRSMVTPAARGTLFAIVDRAPVTLSIDRRAVRLAWDAIESDRATLVRAVRVVRSTLRLATGPGAYR